MLRTILIYGLITGLIVGVPMSVMAVSPGENLHSPLIGYAIMLAALSLIFVAVKRHRDVVQGGVIKFLPAFGMGLAISAVAGIIYVAAWELTQAIAHFDFADAYVEAMVARQKAKGVSGEALAAFEAEMARFKHDYSNPLFRLPMTFAEIFPVGVLVSLVSALLLRNSRFLPARR